MFPIDSPEPDDLARLRQASRGDQRQLAELFDAHRERLARLVHLRMHEALYARLAPSDVLQEAFLQAAAELPRYVQEPKMSVGLWLRTIALQKLTELHRHHLSVQARAAHREISPGGEPGPAPSSAILAAALVGNLTSPSTAAARAESSRRLHVALDTLEPPDREILALRHFEQLSNQEAASVLGITEKAASNRHVRALARLKKVMEQTERN